mmetsp:Transcript_15863/g.51629  ORF Transcript_15863/g.51629 Transcript_15863/m.51629 type:complete len:498 (+) Transcript_15863:25-1518(+)
MNATLARLGLLLGLVGDEEVVRLRLDLPHGRVLALERDQRVVRPALRDLPVLEHEDRVALGDGPEAVGNGHGRPRVAQRRQRVLDVRLRPRVQGRRRLVENDHRRVLHEEARDGDALLLAARELEPPLADDGLPGLLEVADEGQQRRAAGRLVAVELRGPALPVADVVVQRRVEEHRVLGHDAHQPPQRALGHRADVDAADGHAASQDVEEAEQQASARALPGARGPADAQRRPRVDVERHAAEAAVHVGDARVAEDDVLEGHREAPLEEAVGARVVDRRVRVHDQGLLRQQLAQVLQVHERRDQRVVDRAQEVQRREEVDDPDVDGDEAPHVRVAGVDGHGRQRHGAAEAAAEDDLLGDVQRRQRRLHLHGRLLVGRDLLGEAVALVALRREVLDGFEIHEAVREAVVPGVVALVHRRPEALAPERQLDRQGRVEEDRREHQNGERPELEVDVEEDTNSKSLGDGRADVQHAVLHKRIAARDAPVRHADDLAHLFG